MNGTNRTIDISDGKHETKLYQVYRLRLCQVSAWEVRVEMPKKFNRTDDQEGHHQDEGKDAHYAA